MPIRPAAFRRRLAVPSLVLLLAAVAASCRGGGPEAPRGDGARFSLQKQAARSEADAPMAAPAAAPPAGSGQAATQAPVDRKVIRNGGLTVEVPDLARAMNAVRAAVSAAGGYVTNETQGRDEYDVRHGTLTCRVPAARPRAARHPARACRRGRGLSVVGRAARQGPPPRALMPARSRRPLADRRSRRGVHNAG